MMNTPSNQPWDEDVAALAQGMSSELCARIVARHGAMVTAACRRILGDQGLAEDAMQETFVLLVRKAARLPKGTSLGGWLYHAACRTALNHQRTAMRRKIRESSPDAAAATLPDPPAPDWAALEPQLDAAMLALPPRQRDLVVQCYFENQPQRAAARVLGISESVASRELAAAIEALRRFFARRGAAPAAAALVALLTTQAANAATPVATATVTGAMMKAAGTLAPQAAMTLLPVLSMKVTVIVLAGLLLAGAAVYDLASSDSSLRSWTGEEKTAGQPEISAGTAGADSREHPPASSADARARLLAEGKNIWAKPVKFDRLIWENVVTGTPLTAGSETILQMFRASGIMISKTALERLLAALPPGNSSHGERIDFFNAAMQAWIDEAPREATAWAYHVSVAMGDKGLSEINTIMYMTMAAARRNLAAWEAFLEASPDPRIAAYGRVWMQVAEDPGIIWSKSKEAGISQDAIHTYARHLIEKGRPDDALRVLLGSPDQTFKDRGVMGLVSKLPAEALLQLAGREFAGEPGLSNFLRAAAGAPGADYAQGAAFALKSTEPQGYENQHMEWSKKAAGRLYEKWLKHDPAAAISQVMSSGNADYLELFMQQVMHGSRLDEAWMLRTLAGAESKQRDKALAALYRAECAGDPLKTLQRITASEAIEDQINAAKPVLAVWTRRFPKEAAAWLDGLAPAPDLELVATIASEWVDTDPVEAVAFARQRGLGLAHGFSTALAFGIRNQPESSISTVLQSYRSETQYNRLVALTAGYRLPNDPQAAFEFIGRHGSAGWQSVVVDETIRYFKNEDSRAEDFAGALPRVDLTGIEPERLASLAGLYARSLDGPGALKNALAWTLKLPPQAAPAARSQIITGSDLSDPQKLSMVSNWVQGHLVNAEERAQLQQMLQAKAQTATGGH